MQRLDTMPPRFPMNGTLELTLRCNLHCRMCMFRHGDDENEILQAKELSPEAWEHLAKQMQEAGVIDLVITGGEPLLRSDFCEIYRRIYRYGFLITLFTNAILVNEEVMETLREMPPHKIGVTFYGACDETYGRLCGDDRGFTRALAGTEKLASLPSVLELRSTVVRENAGDLETLERLCMEKFGCTVAHTSAVFNCVRGGCMPVSESRLSPEEAVELTVKRAVGRIRSDLPEAYRDKVRIRMEEPTTSCAEATGLSVLGCHGGLEHFTIAYDGRLLGCQLLEEFSTDALRDGFARAWEEWPFQVRLPQVCAECASCHFAENCQVCPAVRMAECGNLSGRPEYICRMTKDFAARKGEDL